MTKRYLEDFAVGQTFGSGRMRVSTHSRFISTRGPHAIRSLRDWQRAALIQPR